jgi:hypothetical protein
MLKGLTLLATVALAGAVVPDGSGPHRGRPCGYADTGSHPITVPNYSKDFRYGKPGTKTGSIDGY